MLIALNGYAKSGKDTVGGVWVNEYGFERRAFADKLREVLYRLNPVIEVSPVPGEAWPSVRLHRIQDVVPKGAFDSESWSDAKAIPEVRDLLQRLGTEAGREVLWDDIWIDAALNSMNINTGCYVITDCRFPNEAEAIKNAGGYVVRVNRPGVGPVNNHVSETSLDDWEFDFVIDNVGSLDDLNRKARNTVERLGMQ